MRVRHALLSLSLSAVFIFGAAAAASGADLHAAARNGDVAGIKQIIADGADLTATDGNGYTALHLAGHNGHLVAVQVLLEYGAAVDARGKLGVTPLHLSALSGQPSIISVLVKAGADVAARDDDGNLPIDYAMFKNNIPSMNLLRQLSETDQKTAGSIEKTEQNMISPPEPVPPLRVEPEITFEAGAADIARAPEPTTRPVQPAAAPAQSDMVAVQLASIGSGLEGAQRAWQDIRNQSPQILKPYQASFPAVDIAGRGRFHRVRVGPLARRQAESLCSLLKGKGQACLVVSN